MASSRPGGQDDAAKQQAFSDMFDKVDGPSREGQVTVGKLFRAMRRQRLPVTQQQVQDMLDQADVSRTGYLSREEFVALMASHEDMLRSAYEAAKDNKGKLALDNLAVALETAGIEATRDQVLALLVRMDTDRDGSISYDEFTHLGWLLMPYNNTEEAFKMFLKLDLGVRPWQTIAAGVLGGAVSRTMFAPLDRAKLLRQAGAVQDTSLIAMIRRLYAQDGLRGWYTGNWANCVQVGPSTALTFVIYEQLKMALCQDPAMPTFREKLVLGGLGGSLSVAAVYPMFTVQTRIAVADVGHYSSMWDVVRRVKRQQGLKGIYRGFWPAIVRSFPYSGLQMGLYYMAKEALYGEDQEPGVAASLGLGGAATAAAVSATHPLDTLAVALRTRGITTPPGQPLAPMTMGQAARNLYEEGGVARFYRGLGPALAKYVPALAVSFAVYEATLKSLRAATATGRQHVYEARQMRAREARKAAVRERREQRRLRRARAAATSAGAGGSEGASFGAAAAPAVAPGADAAMRSK